MHPPKFTHNGEEYDFAHLDQSSRTVDWIDQESQPQIYTVRIRYSDHCYSEEIKGNRILEDSDYPISDNPTRVFCPKRYAATFDLVFMINGLFEKVTSSVILTSKNNFHIYRLDKACEMGRYSVFFRLRVGAKPSHLELYVESAYLKDSRVVTVQRMPFGKALEMTECAKK